MWSQTLKSPNHAFGILIKIKGCDSMYSQSADLEMQTRSSLKLAKLVVVKIGSSSLSDSQGFIDQKKINQLCDELVRLKKRNINVVLVSSGAIRAGKAVLSDHMKNGEIRCLQAFAAIGQVMLMESYRDIMSNKGYHIAQVLLTWDDFRNKKRIRNLVNTFDTLLSLGVIPIINENDTIAVDEIKFGDNDTLSALVSVQLEADILVLLSDIDGLYTGDPSKPESKLVSFVEKVTPDIEKLISEKHGGFGGMATKLGAAKLVTGAGIPMAIANGNTLGVLERIINCERIGTIFRAGAKNV
jgi:glutamate 5-kinase